VKLGERSRKINVQILSLIQFNLRSDGRGARYAVYCFAQRYAVPGYLPVDKLAKEVGLIVLIDKIFH